MKYKAGDRVVLRNERGICWNEDGHMDKYMGQTVTIKNVFDQITFEIIEDDTNYWTFQESDIDEQATEKLNDLWLNICELDWAEGTRYIDDNEGIVWEVQGGDLYDIKFGIRATVNPMKRLSLVRFRKIEIDWSKIPTDTRVLVSDDGENWQKRHFAKHEDGDIYVYRMGKTSWSAADLTLTWRYTKLAEEE